MAWLKLGQEFIDVFQRRRVAVQKILVGPTRCRLPDASRRGSACLLDHRRPDHRGAAGRGHPAARLSGRHVALARMPDDLRRVLAMPRRTSGRRSVRRASTEVRSRQLANSVGEHASPAPTVANQPMKTPRDAAFFMDGGMRTRLQASNRPLPLAMQDVREVWRGRRRLVTAGASAPRCLLSPFQIPDAVPLPVAALAEDAQHVLGDVLGIARSSSSRRRSCSARAVSKPGAPHRQAADQFQQSARPGWPARSRLSSDRGRAGQGCQ